MGAEPRKTPIILYTRSGTLKASHIQMECTNKVRNLPLTILLFNWQLSSTAFSDLLSLFILNSPCTYFRLAVLVIGLGSQPLMGRDGMMKTVSRRIG